MVLHLSALPQSGRLWRGAWILLAVGCALPVGTRTYQELVSAAQTAREHLIVQLRLWEAHPEYNGTPENWTRFASRLLTDRQLMLRVRARHPDIAEQIELDYRRDLTLRQMEVVVAGVALWAIPLGLLYLAGWYVARRKPKPPPEKPQPASVSDPRYRP